ncbi:hypothetical protein [Aliivibrio fischeri]|uniref:hypothetical protein n=1 Tax=Aliivibrio fischeri TaxID=668 RepID=UPI001432F170|nr:hypothetical protein [Aliivibrio fischeri]
MRNTRQPEVPSVVNRVDAIVVRAYFRLGQLGKELPCQDFLSPDSNLPIVIKRTKCS